MSKGKARFTRWGAYISLGLIVLGLSHCATLKKSSVVPLADKSLEACVEKANAIGDTELEKVCKAGGTIVDVIDLFAARQQQAAARDGGVE